MFIITLTGTHEQFVVYVLFVTKTSNKITFTTTLKLTKWYYHNKLTKLREL